MIRIIAFLALLVGTAGAAQANMLLTSAGGGGAPPAGCAESTTFLARTSGLDAAHQNGYKAMICRMVTDGVITGDLSATKCGSKLDALYMFATADSTTALLNICGTAFTGALNGTPNFTADQGYLGVDASTTNFISAFNPTLDAGTVNFVQNSAHLGFFSLTNAAGLTDIAMGAHNTSTSVYSIIYPKYTDGNTYPSINDDSSETGVAMADTRGFYLVSRTGATTEVFYKNGVSVFTSSLASNGLADAPISILNANYSNSGASGWPGRIAMATIGGGLSGADAANMNTAVCLYAAQISATWVGC